MKTVVIEQRPGMERMLKVRNLEQLTTLLRVVVVHPSGREAIAFLSAIETKGGIKFRLTAKRNDCRKESKVTATATFTKM